MDPEKIADLLFNLPFHDRLQLSTVLMLAAVVLAICWLAFTVDRMGRILASRQTPPPSPCRARDVLRKDHRIDD